ncbi:hypothetical protein [Roseovarius sp.]|jgi:hypothetical protein
MAQEVDGIASFGSWSIFKDDVACWAASAAEEVTVGHDKVNAEAILANVAFFRKQPFPEISFMVGGILGEKFTVEAGGIRAQVVLDDDVTYFTEDKEVDLLFAFLRSSNLVLLRPNSEQPAVTFSLDGFQDAYNLLAKTCEFKHADFAFDDVT